MKTYIKYVLGLRSVDSIGNDQIPLKPHCSVNSFQYASRVCIQCDRMGKRLGADLSWMDDLLIIEAEQCPDRVHSEREDIIDSCLSQHIA